MGDARGPLPGKCWRAGSGALALNTGRRLVASGRGSRRTREGSGPGRHGLVVGLDGQALRRLGSGPRWNPKPRHDPSQNPVTRFALLVSTTAGSPKNRSYEVTFRRRYQATLTDVRPFRGVRRAALQSIAPSIPGESEPRARVPLYAHPRVVDVPGRDLAEHPCPQAAAAWRPPLGARPARPGTRVIAYVSRTVGKPFKMLLFPGFHSAAVMFLAGSLPGVTDWECACAKALLQPWAHWVELHYEVAAHLKDAWPHASPCRRRPNVRVWYADC